ncbi:MAG: FecR family protein [Desulfovibrio sp.]|jgi:hypothetical protein|nr:FecR family protein [Desulfovibrio sp.]
MTRTRFSPLPWIASCLSAFLLAAVCSAVPAAEKGATQGKEAGYVLTLTPHAYVERNGQRLELAKDSPVHPGDTLSTDAGGRLRVWLSDETTLSFGGGTTFTLETYRDEGRKSEFRGHMAKGLLRALTGNIVRENPGGFAVTTPEASVGIRGTIITMRSGNGVTSVFVENTMRSVFVNNVNVPGRHKMTVPGNTAPQPILPSDRRQIGQELAFAGTRPTAAAAPEPSRETARTGQAPLSASAAFDRLETNLASLPLSEIGNVGNIPQPPLTPTFGHIVGTLGLPTIPFDHYIGSGSFSFDADLTSGSVSNAAMQGTWQGSVTTNWTGFQLSGGSGAISGNNFSVAYPTGTGLEGSGPTTTTASGSMSGSIQAQGNAITASGTYNAVTDPGGSNFQLTGAFSGSSQ